MSCAVGELTPLDTWPELWLHDAAALELASQLIASAMQHTGILGKLHGYVPVVVKKLNHSLLNVGSANRSGSQETSE